MPNEPTLRCGCPSPYHDTPLLCPEGAALRKDVLARFTVTHTGTVCWEESHAAEVAYYLHFLRNGYELTYSALAPRAWREAREAFEREQVLEPLVIRVERIDLTDTQRESLVTGVASLPGPERSECDEWSISTPRRDGAEHRAHGLECCR
jgi:hypothetical protein